MALVSPQSGILMDSHYIGKYRFFAGNNKGSGDDSSPPYVVPLTISILVSQSLFLNQFYSPASTLIIPIYRTKVRYGYLFVIFMQAVTALLVKWAYTPRPLYMPLLGNQQALPDFNALRQIASLSQTQGKTKANINNQPHQNNRRNNRTLRLNNSANQDNVPSGPLLPEGLTINLSFLSPFSSPDSRASALFSLELLLIRNTRGYLLPLISLMLYFILKPFIGNNNNTNNVQNNNSNSNSSSNSNSIYNINK